MATIDVTVYLNGAFDGWSTEDMDRIDIGATMERAERMLRDRIATATGAERVAITVRREDGGDRWTIADARDAMEQRDLDEIVRDELIDFPWWNTDLWVVMQ